MHSYSYSFFFVVVSKHTVLFSSNCIDLIVVNKVHIIISYDKSCSYSLQCRPCGPGSLGQCYGPEFCCGPFGCIVGREELSECSQAVPTKLVTCYSDYRSCKKLERGVCAAEHFCCNQGTESSSWRTFFKKEIEFVAQ